MSDSEQLALPGAVRVPRKRAPAPPPAAADQLPVARVVVELPLPHLDRPFDYLVPARFDAAAVPGARVRVRFAGQLVDGFILERLEATEHIGRLAYLDRVVSAEPILDASLHELLRAVADRYAGSLSDVLRLAIPPRHARAEGKAPTPAAEPPAVPDPRGWSSYPTGGGFLDALTSGGSPRAVWTASPGDAWPELLATAAVAIAAGGRGALVVLPDRRDCDRVRAALAGLVPDDAHVLLTADLGPEQRYARWLAVRRGRVKIVVGTRAAVFAPVADLGLVAIWDDGDDVHVEPRAPYPHARDVLLLRAHRSGAGALLGGFARTTEAQQLVDSGWAADLSLDRAALRTRRARVVVAGEDSELATDAAARSARLPSVAWRAARTALAADRPVLVQVPRRGWTPSLACARCRTPARCERCAGPLATGPGADAPRCGWCGLLAAQWSCRHCGSTSLRAGVIGASRTAEELGRAFPGVPVRTSGGSNVLDAVGSGAALVVATPGAEPHADGGYGAALLLDGWALLSRPGMRAGEEALRRWLTAMSLVRPASTGGVVVLVADSGLAPVQAIVRGDPAGWAARELAERAELQLPPAVRMAALTGPSTAVTELIDAAALGPEAEVLGPIEVADEQVRAVLRVRRSDALELARKLKAATASRSARRATGAVKVELDPLEPL